jgi:pimeloyl-ACP methyl ester carboxylesterase
VQTPSSILRILSGCMLWAILFFAGVDIPAARASQVKTAAPLPTRFQQSPSAQKKMDGIWVGILEVQGLKLRAILRITQEPTGALSAKLDVPDQGANDLPIDSVSLQGQTFRFEAKNLGLGYEGTLADNGVEIVGQLKQGPATYPVTFKKTDKAPTLGRPQDPKKPYPYLEEEVSYENKIDGVKLTGTLTLPRTGGPFPAVLLITGSGAQDRNETTLGHRPFLVLADHLTRLGIAVLRVDDRGMGGSSIGTLTQTSENYAGDVLAGVEFLKSRKEINPRQIGLAGHSEGGMIAPMAAIRSKDIAFIVLMAGTGMRGDEAILIQNDELLKGQGASNDWIQLARQLFVAIFAILKGKEDSAAAEKQIRATIAAQTAAMTQTQRKGMEPLLKVIDTQLQQFYLTEWFRFFLRYDPHPVLKKVKVPVLAISGDKDLQVPKANLDGIAAALKEGGNKDFSVVLLPQMNHLFQTTSTGLPTEYGEIEETFSPVALKAISDWILKHTTQGKK